MSFKHDSRVHSHKPKTIKLLGGEIAICEDCGAPYFGVCYDALEWLLDENARYLQGNHSHMPYSTGQLLARSINEANVRKEAVKLAIVHVSRDIELVPADPTADETNCYIYLELTGDRFAHLGRMYLHKEVLGEFIALITRNTKRKKAA